MIFKYNTAIDSSSLLALYTDAGWGAYTSQPDKLLQAIANSLLCIAAWDGEELVGLIRVVGDGHTIVYIQDILVLKSHKRRGIGKELMRQVLHRFAEVRQKVLLTDDNPETRGFYEALGFKSCDKGELVAFVRLSNQ